MCTNMRAVIWIAISFGYKALLQLGALFMAFTTRKVNIKGLNDTKEIYAIIYINTLIITVLIVTEFVLKSHRDVYVVLYGLAIFAEATLFLALTFIPKVTIIMLKHKLHLCYIGTYKSRLETRTSFRICMNVLNPKFDIHILMWIKSGELVLGQCRTDTN